MKIKVQGVDVSSYEVTADNTIIYRTPCGETIALGHCYWRNNQPCIEMTRAVQVNQLHKIVHLVASWAASALN